MRIVLDLQACQTADGDQAIARHAMSFARALATHAGSHDLKIVLNGRMGSSIMPLRAALADVVAQEDIRIFTIAGPVAEHHVENGWRTRAAERLRENYLALLKPDIVHLSNVMDGLVDDAVNSITELSPYCDTTANLHQLLPLPQQAQLSDRCQRDWYFRKLRTLKQARLLFATTAWARQQAFTMLQMPHERVIHLPPGVDVHMLAAGCAPPSDDNVAQRLGLRLPFVLSLADEPADAECNRLIEAFAVLPAAARTTHQLCLISTLSEPRRQRLRAHAAKFGLSPDRMVLLDHPAHAELAALYRASAVTVAAAASQSACLSALEAIACGAAVIGTHDSGVAEIIGRDDALFDATRDELALKIFQALTVADFNCSLRIDGTTRARQFSWDATAKAAIGAYEELHDRRATRGHAVTATLPPSASENAHARPRLAYVSPLPPEESGVADYSAMLLPELARRYAIDVVVAQDTVTTPWIASTFPVRSAAWFADHAHEFDRILYHFGNSNFHLHMFDLLERHPGVVVLHDFFLSGALSNPDLKKHNPDVFLQSLYASHGYPALLDFERFGEEAAVWKYPCNKAVLDNAVGVIVHSAYPRELAETWYGPGTARHWQTIPLLRARTKAPERVAARRAIEVPEDAFLVCSYGMLGPTKLNALLLDAWIASPLSKDPRCFLVFAGKNHPSEYGNRITRTIAGSGCAERIRITGFNTETMYQTYLCAADVAVQLRARSRGETSASILDCLAHGIPTIVNRNGAAAELPDDVLIKLNDDVTMSELDAALVRLWQDAPLRQGLAQRARELVRTRHHPAGVGDLYHAAIEHFAGHATHAHYQRVVEAVTTIEAPVEASEDDLIDTAAAIAANQPGSVPRQMLVDISALVQVDIKTGIQRVVRSVLNVLLHQPPPGYRIEPIYDAGGHYLYARRHGVQLAGLPELELEDAPVDFKPGDIFLGLDLFMHGTALNQVLLGELRNRGVTIYFVVYDVLPVLRPEVFPGKTESYFRLWLECIAAVSDGLICISRSVADELAHWIESAQPTRHGPTRIGYFHLGADIVASLPSVGLAADADQALSLACAHPSILMVGTVEPRKGYAQTLDAFELLWSQGVKVNLIIVGKEGWMVEDLAARLRNHPRAGTNLFWMQGVSDQMLEQLYERASVLLAASEGEGFGLPLIEAAQHGLRIIARGLPVFREVAGEHAYFFDSMTAAGLATAIADWLALDAAGCAPVSSGMPWLTWVQSTAQLMTTIEKQQWYRIV